jgi:hypothetical protein
MVHDQPLAVDLTEASGPTQPEIGLLSIVHGSAYPVEAVGECNVIAHSDVEVVNFISFLLTLACYESQILVVICTGGLSPFAHAAHTILLVEHLKRLWDALPIGRGNRGFPTELANRLRVGDAHGGREEVGREGG